MATKSDADATEKKGDAKESDATKKKGDAKESDETKKKDNPKESDETKKKDNPKESDATKKKADDFAPHPLKDQLPGVDICVTSSPSWPEAILLGFQHYVVMLGTTVLITYILVPLMGGGNVEKAEVINTILFVSGINTLLQSLFGTRLPVIMGASYTYIIPSIYVTLSYRFSYYFYPHQRFEETMRTIQGALIIASLFHIVIGFFGLWGILARFLTPLAAAPLVILTGLGFFTLGFPQLAKCVEVGLPALTIFIFLSQHMPHFVKLKKFKYERFAVLFTIGIVWAYAEILTAAGAYDKKSAKTQFSCRTDRSGLIGAAHWIRVPYPFQWGSPRFDAGEIFVMMAASLVAIVESTAVFIAASRFGSATPIPPSVLSRGIGWQGIGVLLAGLFGTPTGSTASVENAGLLGQTKVGSRRVVQIAVVFMLFFSILGKFGAVLASIPLPIFAALYCVLFAYVVSAGLGLLQFCNLNSFRTMFILGISIFLGLSITQYFNEYLFISGHGPVHTRTSAFNVIMQVIFSSAAMVGLILAFFLDATHSYGHASVRRDSGRHWWEKFRGYNTDTRSKEFYALPFKLNKFFPSL